MFENSHGETSLFFSYDNDLLRPGRVAEIAHYFRQEETELPSHEADVRLVEAVLAGSETAWHTFIDRYTGLIIHVLRRYLFDEDQVRGTYVDVLENLHTGRLETYQGRSSLSTWLMLVSRNAATDCLRHEHGRREVPRGLRRLSHLHQEIYRLYYVEGETFTATLKQVWLLGHRLTEEELIDQLGEIDAQLTDRTCRRVRYDLAAESLGAASGRLLEYCDAVNFEAENGQHDQDPLNRLIMKEAEIRSLKALRYVAELPAEERRILSLRFEEGLSAQEIAERLGIANRRRVFTILDRIVRKLRRQHRNSEKPRKIIGKTSTDAVSSEMNGGKSSDEDDNDRPQQSLAK